MIHCASGNHSQVGDPEKLHHDSWRQRSTVLEATDGSFHDEPGVAQTVHWARTPGFDINGKILEELIESNVQTEDGLVDGLMTNLPFHENNADSENLVVFGQATHVGCGWIQFPTTSNDPLNTVGYFSIFFVPIQNLFSYFKIMVRSGY